MQKINVLLFALLVSSGLYAQDSLFFIRNSYTISRLDTFSNQTFSIVDSLYSLNLNNITGVQINFSARVNSTLVSAPQFTSDSIIPTDTIYGGGNVYRSLKFTFISDTTPPFEVGPNGVVIWPIISINSTQYPTPTSDSIRINTYYYPLGIEESSLAKMYLFETPGLLNIVFGDAENIVQQVRIYDVLGQGVYVGSPDQSRNIPTAGWNAGIYLCEVSTATGDRRTFKFKVE
jgi:hypothetical protein